MSGKHVGNNVAGLLQITDHPQHILYKTNHLFFHFTKLTTLIHNHQGRTPHKVNLLQAPTRGEQQKWEHICSPPTGANIEGDFDFCSLHFTSVYVCIYVSKSEYMNHGLWFEYTRPSCPKQTTASLHYFILYFWSKLDLFYELNKY